MRRRAKDSGQHAEFTLRIQAAKSKSLIIMTINLNACQLGDALHETSEEKKRRIEIGSNKWRPRRELSAEILTQTQWDNRNGYFKCTSQK